jgi:molecular chaperone Hsp33
MASDMGAAIDIPDDLVEPFEVKSLGVRGRIVRLGPMVDQILRLHDYPDAVSLLLAEAVALTAMLGSSLKFEGKFILQSRSDGPVDMLVAHWETPGRMRAYARFDKAMVADLLAKGHATPAALLGKGYLAMTVDQGADMERYQGIVPLDGTSLEEAAHTYFRQSEQIPTSVRLAAGPLISRGAGEQWRAGGILIQHVPSEGGPSPIREDQGDVPEHLAGEHPPEDDRWVEARFLLETVEDHELLDPALAPERLLYRLFHEQGVTAYPPSDLERHCSCSRERVSAMLKGFTDQERADMVENGKIGVTCEFCSAHYGFFPDEIDR